jgi:thiol-disulfide isomerase/thioredoxin
VVFVGTALGGLWLAGVLFQVEHDGVTSDGVSLAPADTSVETPNERGMTVGLQEGDLAPDFAVSSFEGQRFRLSDFRGRAVIVNFWATWCGPCKAELPDLSTLLERHGEERLAVLAVNYGETPRLAGDFIDALAIELTAFAYDPKQDVSRRYAVTGLPVSYFIDARGVVARVVIGQLTPAIMESGVQDAFTAISPR